jgi:hypothetical protein
MLICLWILLRLCAAAGDWRAVCHHLAEEAVQPPQAHLRHAAQQGTGRSGEGSTRNRAFVSVWCVCMLFAASPL